MYTCDQRRSLTSFSLTMPLMVMAMGKSQAKIMVRGRTNSIACVNRSASWHGYGICST